MSPPRSASWKVCGPSSLVWRLWDDEYVLLNTASGDTHLLDLLSGEVLRCLEEGPADAEVLAARVLRKMDPGPDRDPSPLAARIEDILTTLDELGLVEPAGE
jgi:PqqD family protein of HPr-rel-A system